MIILPTRRRLELRRDKLYQHLISITETASVQQVEHIMRQIHIINTKLRTYFISKNEPKEIFEDE